MIRIVVFALSAFVAIFTLFAAVNFFLNIPITFKVVAIMVVLANIFALYLAALFNSYRLDQQEFSKPQDDQS